MTEVRTTSATGGQKGVKPERYDLLPKEALDSMARVYAFGAEKYADHNWRRGYEWSKSFAAAMRHMWAFWNGETFDEESGLPHLAHAAFHLNAMMTWLERDGEGGQFDDRWINSPALQDVTQEEIDAVAETLAEPYGPPPTPPAPFVEYAELAERGRDIASNWIHPDAKVMDVLKEAADSPTVQRSYERREDDKVAEALPEGWEDMGYVSEDSVRIYKGDMPSETAKKLGMHDGVVQNSIQMHFNGGPDQVAIARETLRAVKAYENIKGRRLS